MMMKTQNKKKIERRKKEGVRGRPAPEKKRDEMWVMMLMMMMMT